MDGDLVLTSSVKLETEVTTLRLSSVLKEHEKLFSRLLGSTDVTEHVINIGDAPPSEGATLSNTIAFLYRDCVREQLQEMVKEGII